MKGTYIRIEVNSHVLLRIGFLTQICLFRYTKEAEMITEKEGIDIIKE